MPAQHIEVFLCHILHILGRKILGLKDASGQMGEQNPVSTQGQAGVHSPVKGDGYGTDLTLWSTLVPVNQMEGNSSLLCDITGDLVKQLTQSFTRHGSIHTCRLLFIKPRERSYIMTISPQTILTTH